METSFVGLSAQSVLKNYFKFVTATEFEQIPTTDAVKMVWNSVFNGKKYKVDRMQRPLVASQDHAQDIRYLIDLCNIKRRIQA